MPTSVGEQPSVGSEGPAILRQRMIADVIEDEVVAWATFQCRRRSARSQPTPERAVEGVARSEADAVQVLDDGAV
jgi:hypothetical protein